MDVNRSITAAADNLISLLDAAILQHIKNPARTIIAMDVIRSVVICSFRLQELVGDLKEILQADGVLVVILDSNKAHVVSMAGGDVVDEIIDEDRTSPVMDSYCKFCVATGIPYIVNDAVLEPSLSKNPYVNLVRGYVGSAIWVKGLPIGALCATNDNPKYWNPEEVEIIKTKAGEVSEILEKALDKYMSGGTYAKHEK